ncbi:hypothetical protein L211DRAFT_854129 [Terfezia boudieri ATCC MYA-4762]|uniref:Uncharacterized protein n=1 Tax=Terfezia boudieri ATCC MYA-4762 TaxID=1051890 RepID=A0A3N4L6C9_9PEZI|nr:hypothetical protein L211DRAFT_854129 [Terfezia boudieri ATCC MYA-4762]
MAPPPKGILFGPVQDWGKGSSKVLLEFDGEDGVKKIRQYILEDVTKWHLVPEFLEKGNKALGQVISNSRHLEKEWEGNISWEHHVSQLEKENREEEEVIKVVDGPSVERAIEILNRGIVIQDGSVNRLLEGFNFEHS